MKSGDRLARGAHSDSFAGTGVSELESDLKLQPKEYVCEKYTIDDTQYGEFLRLLSEHQPLPLRAAPIILPRIDLEPLLPEERPTHGYKGTALGDNITIALVDREHSAKLIIPKIMESRQEIGYAYSVGEACKWVKQGWLVLFDAFAANGKEIKLVDEDGVERTYLNVVEQDVLMRLERVLLP